MISPAGAALCRVSPATSAFTPALRSPLVQPTLRSVVRRAAVAPRMAVEVVVKDLPGSQKQLTISVSADECENAYKAVLQRLQKGVQPPTCLPTRCRLRCFRDFPHRTGFPTADSGRNSTLTSLATALAQAEIPGFRKGKAPTAMVLNHFGKESVSAEACEKIIGAAVPMALQMKDIRAIGQVPATQNAPALPQFVAGEKGPPPPSRKNPFHLPCEGVSKNGRSPASRRRTGGGWGG